MLGFSKNAEKFSAIILAAGKSVRMGFPKLSLMFDNSKTFLEKITNVYIDFGCKEIILVVNTDGANVINKNQISFSNNVKIVINPHPEMERFYSLKLGVKALKSKTPTFIHNIDNPFIDVETLGQLARNLSGFEYVSPSYKNKGGHPGLVSKTVVDNIANEVKNNLHLKEYLSQFKKLKVEIENEHVLLNINTKEEYENWKKMKYKLSNTDE